MATSTQIQPAAKLTATELIVLQAVSDGKTAKQIAFAKGGSHRTIEMHLRNCRKKLGCWSTPHAIATAFRRGLLE